jgi:MerR family transcriptional regulator/heat shock protein HspR
MGQRKSKATHGAANEPRYIISVAARMLGTQTHTLRYYERIGIIEPLRSMGNIRLYSESDIMRLRRVRSLIDDLGINLAGVEVILHMVERMGELQKQIEDLEAELNRRNRKSSIGK